MAEVVEEERERESCLSGHVETMEGHHLQKQPSAKLTAVNEERGATSVLLRSKKKNTPKNSS